jgi:tetratricopeptide (TPR) repeat protein
MAEPSSQLLVIGTYRASELSGDHLLGETLADLHRSEGVDTIALGGLDEAGLLSLLEAIAGQDLDDEAVALAGTLARETAGNPFFAGEILRHMAETGALIQDEYGRWTARADLGDTTMPDSVRTVIAQRVSRLGEPMQKVLRAASVIGRDFDFALLAAVVDTDEDTVLDLLDAAMTAALVAEVPGARDRFTFTHALVQHTLYENLSVTRRGRLHRRVAEVLESEYGKHAGERIGELATHWLAAAPAEPTKAVHYARLAGERALAQLAPDEAIRWFTAALERINDLTDADEIDRAQLIVHLGTAQRDIGDPAYHRTLLDAARFAQQIDHTPTLVAAALANTRGFFSSSGQIDEVIAVLQAALAAIGTGDSPARARLLAVLADELTWVSNLTERRNLQDEAVAIARRVDDVATLVDVLNRSCNPGFNFPHTLEDRRELNAEARRLAAQLTDPNLRFVAADRFLQIAVQSADPAGIAEAAQTMYAIADATGRPLLRWFVLSDAGTALAALAGDAEEVERLARQYLKVGRAAGQPDAFFEYAGMILHARMMQGRAEETIESIEGPQETRGLPIVRALHAAAYCDADRRDEARSLLDAEHATGFDLPLDVTWSRATTAWAEVAARLEHHPACVILYERLLPFALQIASNEGTVQDPIAYSLGLLATCLGNYDEAETHYAMSQSISERVGAVYSLARTHLAWAVMLVQRDRPDDHQRARDLARQALAVAEQRGYHTIRRRATRLLEQLTP